MKTTTITCDICKKYVEHDAVQYTSLPVVMTTETCEGRSVKPYLSYVKVDLCKACSQRYIDSFCLRGAGAQGYNEYTWIAEAKHD